MQTNNPFLVTSQGGENSASVNLRATAAAVGQAKVAIHQLRRCYESQRIQKTLDRLSGGMDIALDVLASLDFGGTGGAQS